MLPPENYPHCRLTCTMREAIVALSASAVKLQDGYIMLPRYVLVLDDDDRLVGVVSRRELLKGLIPHLHDDRETEAHIKELVPFGGSMPSEVTIRWTSLFSRSAIEASMAPIQSVMVPIKGTVQVNDTLVDRDLDDALPPGRPGGGPRRRKGRGRGSDDQYLRHRRPVHHGVRTAPQCRQ